MTGEGISCVGVVVWFFFFVCGLGWFGVFCLFSFFVGFWVVFLVLLLFFWHSSITIVGMPSNTGFLFFFF